jgi:hypothetical protein
MLTASFQDLTSKLRGIGSDHANFLRFVAFAAGCDFELDSLAFVEGLVSFALDVGEVNEHIVATFT